MSIDDFRRCSRVLPSRHRQHDIAGCGMAADIKLETIDDGRGGVSIVIPRIEFGGMAHDRVLAAISGGHGVPVANPVPAAGSPVERVA